jgi:type IV secretory pathway VirB10-like protein
MVAMILIALIVAIAIFNQANKDKPVDQQVNEADVPYSPVLEDAATPPADPGPEMVLNPDVADAAPQPVSTPAEVTPLPEPAPEEPTPLIFRMTKAARKPRKLLKKLLNSATPARSSKPENCSIIRSKKNSARRFARRLSFSSVSWRTNGCSLRMYSITIN